MTLTFRQAFLILAVLFTACFAFAATVPRPMAIALFIVAFAIEFGGIVLLTIRRSGVATPGAAMLVFSLALLLVYLVYVLFHAAVGEHGPELPFLLQRGLYAGMASTAVMAALTFPWRLLPVSGRQVVVTVPGDTEPVVRVEPVRAGREESA